MNLCIAHGGDLGEPSGGTDRVSALAQGLQDRDFNVLLVIPEPSDNLPSRLDDVEIIEVTPRLSGSLARASSVIQTARRVAHNHNARLQIEHSSLAGVGTIHGLEGFVLDMHDVAYSRFDHVDTSATPLFKRGVKWLERRAVNRAAHIIVVSETMYDLLRILWDVPPSKMTIVPNGFFPETISGLTDVSVTPGRIAFFGTLHPKVDVETLQTIVRLPDVSELVVIGDGAQRKQIEQFSNSIDNLRVTGRLPDEDAFELVASSEVVVNPQIVSDIQRASSPVKLFYYAALGRPMVVTSGPSIVEYLVRKEAATTAYSKENFVNRVRAVLGDESLSQTLSENAKTVSREFRWSERITDVERMYKKELLKGNKE